MEPLNSIVSLPSLKSENSYHSVWCLPLNTASEHLLYLIYIDQRGEGLLCFEESDLHPLLHDKNGSETLVIAVKLKSPIAV